MKSKVRKLELLAPARDAATAFAAIRHGADAVYIGAPEFGARAAASNSIEDLKSVVDYAHQFGVRVYVTLNTIIYNNETDRVRRLIYQLYRIGVDALIVQDLGILQMNIPPIELHASTQTDARTPEKVAMLAQAGFSQIVVPREFSLEQIRMAHEAAAPYEAAIEAFVHGALCVSYSGDCHAGAVLAGRSANRGECPQICRLQFRLTDESGQRIPIPDNGSDTRHWLSLADMNRLDNLMELMEAGVSSFKIEGRLKSESYVKNVTAAYSRALNEIVALNHEEYERASFGSVAYNFTPDVSKSFNRGFTDYFLKGEARSYKNISSWNTPKWIGKPIAKVLYCKGNVVKVKKFSEIHNGDGLGYFDNKGQFNGFRVNKAVGDDLYLSPGSSGPTHSGAILYRNVDTAYEALMMQRNSAIRTIALTMTLRRLQDGHIILEVNDERGNRISIKSEETYQDTARTPQTEQRRSTLSRLGETIYRLNSLDDRLGDIFVPSKNLTALRRRALDVLESNWRMRFDRHFRRASLLSENALSDLTTDYHDNVANSFAEKFYTSHGAKIGEKAIEIAGKEGHKRIMTTRYCLRRSLGACLKTNDASRLPHDLYLEAPIGRLQLEFNCKNCNMHVLTDK